eukprot:1737250-Amphidinium_carterae.1
MSLVGAITLQAPWQTSTPSQWVANLGYFETTAGWTAETVFHCQLGQVSAEAILAARSERMAPFLAQVTSEVDCAGWPLHMQHDA